MIRYLGKVCEYVSLNFLISALRIFVNSLDRAASKSQEFEPLFERNFKNLTMPAIAERARDILGAGFNKC